MPGATRLDLHIEAKAVRTPGGAARTVLRDVRFSAGPGEFLAVFAPSGTGKTTTLRVVLGLDRDFAGAVQRPAGRVGVVFQEPRLLPWLTVAENLRLVAGEGTDAPDIAALLEQVGLPGAADRRPGELSLGMARRAALARALIVDPTLLVLDEPFASLDPQLVSQLAGVVSRWARKHAATVLLATHDLDQALGIADRILVLSGTPATLAADLAVPDPADVAAVTALRDGLRARFPFLGTLTKAD